MSQIAIHFLPEEMRKNFRISVIIISIEIIEEKDTLNVIKNVFKIINKKYCLPLQTECNSIVMKGSASGHGLKTFSELIARTMPGRMAE